MHAIRGEVRGLRGREALRDDRLRDELAHRRADGARDRTRRRGDRARLYLYGYPDCGPRRGRDPGDRGHRRDDDARPAGARGGDRSAGEGGDPGAHVGPAVRHGRDRVGGACGGDLRRRRRVPGGRRGLRGPHARLDRRRWRLQLQLLQEHDHRRGRRGRHRQRRVAHARDVGGRPMSILLGRARGRGTGIHGERGARERVRGARSSTSN